MNFTLTVALSEADAAVSDSTTEALSILHSDTDARVQFVPAGADADIRLALIPNSPRPDALWMLPGNGYFEAENIDQTPSVGTQSRAGDEIAAIVQDNLDSMARAFNLLRMAGHFDYLDMNIDLRLRTKTRQQRQLADLDFSAVPVLVVNDQVHVQAKNEEEFPIDINVLHIGSDYSISHFFSGRMQPGDTLKKGLFRITDGAFGRDRVVIILSPAEPQTPVENLGFLPQEAVAVTRGTGDAAGSGFAAALRNAGFGTVTRGAMALDDDSGPAPVILQFDIDTAPDEG